ncbi:MAG TPA: MFS transporter, partial [Actinomycetota bacterium]|nr:MFS transporter [Actinomycetota bacterium]
MTLGMALAVLMPMAANFAVAGALPQIEGDLARATLDPRWVQSVYLIVFTAFMLAGGSLGDRFGRKRLLLWGLVLFIASSIACGFCQNIDQLVGARAVQGFGAALLVPATLSNLVAAFPDKGRGAALGLWAAMSAIGVLYGPLFSAYVLESYSWQWIFYSMAAVAGAGLLLALAAKETRDRSLLRRLDFVGVVVGGCALGLFSYAMSEGNLVGWRNEYVLGALAAAALLVVIFALIETRRRHPIVTLWYSGHATFSGANAVAAAAFFTLIAISLLLLAYLRTVLGYPTEEAAQRLLPLAGALLVVSPVAGMISDRLGSRALMTYGCLLAAGGLGLLLQADLEPAYQNVVLP